MKTLPVTPPKILLVDDNHDGLIVRKALLEELGYRVTTAQSGEEGLKTFESEKFDVVVTDFRMTPGMNGAELIEKVRQYDPNARIILLSGFVEPLGLTERNTGADAVIAKSSNEPAQLARWVKRLANHGNIRKPPSRQTGSAKSEAASR
ncbi:MAG TPA: response regulator [Bryobacteraceae bacterium]|nr:response regulator [Bryobacteraceae bacterium]